MRLKQQVNQEKSVGDSVAATESVDKQNPYVHSKNGQHVVKHIKQTLNLPSCHFQALNELFDFPDFNIAIGRRFLTRHFVWLVFWRGFAAESKLKEFLTLIISLELILNAIFFVLSNFFS